MSEYAAKEVAYGSLGNAPLQTDTRRDTGRVTDMLAQCHALISKIEESVGIARNALWGPMPESPSTRGANIKAVEPSGFLPAVNASLVSLMQRMEALDISARNLRNL
jgi:hypothetical protein